MKLLIITFTCFYSVFCFANNKLKTDRPLSYWKNQIKYLNDGQIKSAPRNYETFLVQSTSNASDERRFIDLLKITLNSMDDVIHINESTHLDFFVKLPHKSGETPLFHETEVPLFDRFGRRAFSEIAKDIFNQDVSNILLQSKQKMKPGHIEFHLETMNRRTLKLDLFFQATDEGVEVKYQLLPEKHALHFSYHEIALFIEDLNKRFWNYGHGGIATSIEGNLKDLAHFGGDRMIFQLGKIINRNILKLPRALQSDLVLYFEAGDFDKVADVLTPFLDELGDDYYYIKTEVSTKIAGYIFDKKLCISNIAKLSK